MNFAKWRRVSQYRIPSAPQLGGADIRIAVAEGPIEPLEGSFDFVAQRVNLSDLVGTTARTHRVSGPPDAVESESQPVPAKVGFGPHWIAVHCFAREAA